ncbi:ATP-binding cassette domain-containing protein [Wenyingzhuangia sp. 2_MG-2023]|uniref:ATP-binding cassette domain-containing protein n=1 Tax=Wenyingzhuangia sp. 2_MG-2023 TaxID=3062639 RepID=UPI0026E1DC48|nr:ATP-binding cassette domain-containing protein [Wenyingzhuangia sp. 2_MG-2023]MDO6736631.1 ATP-binding cassette domain-containing protein [Wenyingzhuangia sp. 2_MG-2023]
MNHIAVFNKSTTQNTVVNNLLKGKLFPEFKERKGGVFSLSVIEKFIEEEQKHDDFTLTNHKIDGNGNVRSLTSFSSGQQKQLLLAYLRKQNYDFLVLDKPYDCLDIASQEDLEKELIKLSEEVIFIQLFKIRDEVLPFIDEFYLVDEKEILFSGSAKEYDIHFYTQLKPYVFEKNLPLVLNKIEVENPLVKFTDVNIFYEQTRQIVNNINWTINKGEFWHLKGPNGSGKTSLLTMITGDNPKAFGEDIILFGQKKGTGETVWELKKKIGYFSPNLIANFNKLFTVQHMVLSGFYDSIGLYEKPTGHEIYEADKWLDLVGLKEKKQSYFVRLSPEMQRIILIIRAMVKQPPLLILDEPTNELDDYATSMLTAFINKIHQETDTAILYVSHRMLVGLHPDKVYELIPTEKGSVGKVVV